MRSSLALAIVVGAVVIGGPSCEKKDDCAKFAAKAAPVLGKVIEGKIPTEAEIIKSCRTATKRDPVIDCVLAAKDRPTVEECHRTAFAAYSQKVRSSEGRIQAKSLAAAAMALFAEAQRFAVGTTEWIPATDCCQQPDKRCPVDSAQWQSAAPFQEMGFSAFEPSAARVRYDGTAAAFTAVVWVDSDCDGKESEGEAVKLTGSVVGGAPMIKLDPPEPQ